MPIMLTGANKFSFVSCLFIKCGLHWNCGRGWLINRARIWFVDKGLVCGRSAGGGLGPRFNRAIISICRQGWGFVDMAIVLISQQWGWSVSAGWFLDVVVGWFVDVMKWRAIEKKPYDRSFLLLTLASQFSSLQQPYECQNCQNFGCQD